MVNGVVYIGSDDDNIYALNASNGEKLWMHATDGPIGYSSPAVVPDGIVYIGSSDSSVYALNATNGDKLWSYPILDGAFESSPAVVNGVLYIDSINGNVYALSTPPPNSTKTSASITLGATTIVLGSNVKVNMQIHSSPTRVHRLLQQRC